jgi:capsular exopolysaccharide synthesis family protein
VSQWPAGVANYSDSGKAEWLQPPAEEEGLRRYVETIRERLGLVIVTVLVTTGMAALYVFTAPKTYEARADLLVTPISTEDPVIRSLPLIFESVDPTRDVETASEFVTNLNVAERAKQETGSSESPRGLLEKVSAAPVAQSNIVAVTAEGDSPEEAQELANAFATTTVEERTEQLHTAIDAQLPAIRAQFRQGGSQSVEDTLAIQIAQLQTLSEVPDPTVRLQTEADLPTRQASPRPVLSIAGGIIAGLVLGVAGAFAAQALDPRLRREAQLRRQYQLPILARIPRETQRAARRGPLGPRQISGVGAEAYRTLRATLEASRGTNPDGSRVILVTGPSPSEGKSTTATNLASSLALAGKSVILIEADLRRPSVARTLGIEAAHGGVVSVLIENVRLADALTPTPTYGPNLQALLADYEGGWIAELFSLPAAQRMIVEARQLADYVVIDSPPLNEVVDALPLAREADDVLIVVRLGKSRMDRIAQLSELLAENGIRPAGFAVVGVSRPGKSAYRYYRSQQSLDGSRERSLFGSGVS